MSDRSLKQTVSALIQQEGLPDAYADASAAHAYTDADPCTDADACTDAYVNSATGETVKDGDTILFGKYSGQEIKLDGEEYLIMREDEVLGVVQ